MAESPVVALYETGDATPLSLDEHSKLLATIEDWFQACDRKRADHVKDWHREYMMYRSFVQPRKSGQWRSRFFIPISFHVIETEMPKLIAQLPTPIVLPVGPEDVKPAARMEDRLKWAFDQSGLYVQLVAAYRSALKYGTGIIKVYPGKRVGWVPQQVPVTETRTVVEEVPVTDPETGEAVMGLGGTPLTEQVEREIEEPATDPETGEPVLRQVRSQFTYYQGPIAEAVDIEQFWPSPEATSIEDARYVFHEVWRDESYVRAKFEEGVYSLPEGMTLGDLWEPEDTPAAQREGEIGKSSQLDPNRRAVRVWEVWTDDSLTTVLNRRLIVRLQPSPFAHGQKPFVRILDHFQEHEFYGVGELGPILGIQDIINALWNSRIDNVRLVMQRVFAVDPKHLVDLRDLRLEPGKPIRINAALGIDPREILLPIDFPDVTSSAYEEVSELIGLVERVLAVSAYQSGTDSATLNDTATGVALITEAGNSRFALKVRMAELTGTVPLARMYGSILQQFSPPEVWIRREGPEGQPDFGDGAVTAAEIQGQLDYDIEAASSTQTESIRKEQDASLFQLLQGRTDAAGIPLANDREMLKDLLRSWGKKDIGRIVIDPEVFLRQQALMQQSIAGPGLPPGMGMGPPPGEPGLAEGVAA